jgi:transposase
MYQGKYVFSQIMEMVVRYQFNQCVERYDGEYRVKNLTCWEQFLALAFGQLSGRKSLRDVVVCLSAHRDKLYHLGFHSPIYLPTLARANEHRDWRIYRDYALIIISEARQAYVTDRTVLNEIAGAVYAVDSTTVELCLRLFPWARLKKVRAAIKLSLGIELRGNIPSFFSITSGKEHDVHFLDRIEYEKNAYYILDRGYLDFARLYHIHQASAFFVTRAKTNWSFHRLYSRHFDKATGVRCDQIVKHSNYYAIKAYPEKLRRVKYYDKETKRYYVFVTNNFDLPAQVIADLYKHRWQVELFFKWIKQHLAIETFWGRSANAVKIQICVALAAYLLIALLKKNLRIDRNSYEILQILSVSQFDKTPIAKLISEAPVQITENSGQKQAKLWNY